MFQSRGITAIACILAKKQMRVGMLIVGEIPPDTISADLVDRDNTTGPTTPIFLPEPCVPGVYYDQLLEIAPF
ncbi:MAG: hypothetical protein AAGA67_07715 [Cyanobacteria bacterium P01_F01_bin.153]